MIREKTYKILTTPGLSIFAISECKNCANLTFENTCQIWAFPEKKWGTGNRCASYDSVSVEFQKPE